jgi:hypothetical protein
MTAVDGSATLVCDHCPRVAETVHVVPELASDETRVVLLACSQHDPGGEWWYLRDLTDDVARALRDIRPDLPPGLAATVRGPEVHWKEVDERAPDPSPGGLQTRHSLGGGAIVLVIVIAALYLSGSLDKPLSSVGLNMKPCVQNAFGATFCGDDAKRLCKQFGGPACDELGYDSAGSITEDLENLDSDSDGSPDESDSAPFDPALP